MEALLRTALKEPRRRSTRQKSWAPSDLRTNRNRERKLLRKMETCIKILGNSRFYHHFRQLLQTSAIFEHLRRVLGAESKMEMIIYGIGRFEVDKDSMLLLSLAMSMQRDSKWIGNIRVFDPVLSVTECRILEALGCSVTCFNEEGMRKVSGPTLFFMPYCELFLFNNLLQANWNPDLLSKVVIFGSSFNFYKCLGPDVISSILAAEKFTNEFPVTVKNPRLPFLQRLSWIFFNLELQFMNGLPYKNGGFCRTIGRQIDLRIDPCREETLMQRMEKCINNFESSKCYHNFQYMLQSPPISKHLRMAMGSESKMKMVIIFYNGNIEMYESSRLHVSLAILMKKHFKWIGDIQVFHPYISATECQVLKALGCQILSLDGYRRSWQALKPTIFFIPDNCCTKLCSHLLKANWKSSLLSNIVLWGNSLTNGYAKEDSHMDLEYTMRYIGAARSFAKEFRIKIVSGDYYKAFHHLSWHFFGHVTEAELQFMNEFLEKGCHISLLA